MTSQLVIFRAFLFIFFRPPDPSSEKNYRKSTNEKNLALPHEPRVLLSALSPAYVLSCLNCIQYGYPRIPW